MVHRVHADAADLAVGIDGIPALPDRRRAHVDLVEPAREILIQKQRVGVLVRAVVGERTAERGRAEEAGFQVHVGGFQQRAQARRDLLARERRRKAEVERNGVAGLRCRGAETARRVVFAADRVADLVGAPAVHRVIGGFAERAGRVCDAHRRFIVVRGAEERHVRAAHDRLRVEAGLRAVEREPVREVEFDAGPQTRRAVRLVVAVDPVGPELHALVAVFERRPVAGREVRLPRHDRRGVRPAAVPAARREHRVLLVRPAADHQRRDVRHLAVRELLLLEQVAAVLRVERGAVHVVVRGRAEHLRVAGPAHALVALRAVGRHIEEVVALAPDRVQVQAVDLLVRGDDLAGLLEVGVHRPALDIRDAVERRNARELHEAEAVERRDRPHKGLSAVRNVAVFAQRRAHVVAVEAVVLQELAELQAQLGAGGQVRREGQPARDVLAEVEHELVFRRLHDLRREDVLRLDRQREARREAAEARFRVDLHRLPAVERAGGRRPVFDLQPRVVALAVVDAAERQRRGRRLPALVRDNHGFAPVGRDVQLAEQQVFVREDVVRAARLVRLVAAGLAIEAEAALGPAVADDRADNVFAAFHEVGHVVGLVLDPAVVGGAAGREVLVAGLFAVHVQLVDAEAREVRAGGEHLALHLKRAAHVRRRVGGQAGRNALAGKRLVELCGLKPGGVARRALAIVAADRDAPEVARAGRKRDFHRHAERRRRAAFPRVEQNCGKVRVGRDLHARPKLLFCRGFLYRPRDHGRFEVEAQRVHDPVRFHALNFHIDRSFPFDFLYIPPLHRGDSIHFL